jgi:hypothetical protein
MHGILNLPQKISAPDPSKSAIISEFQHRRQLINCKEFILWHCRTYKIACHGTGPVFSSNPCPVLGHQEIKLCKPHCHCTPPQNRSRIVEGIIIGQELLLFVTSVYPW